MAVVPPMGGHLTEWFVDDPSHFKCGVCMEIWNNPYQCSKGHILCISCFTAAIASKPECPICKVPTMLETLSANLFARDSVSILPTKCHEGEIDPSQDHCRWVGPLHQRNTHLALCNFRMLVECPLYTTPSGCIDCSITYESRQALRIHLQQCSDSKVVEIHRLKQELTNLQEYGHSVVRSDAIEGQPSTVYCGSVDNNREKSGLGVTFDVATPNSYYYIGSYRNNLRHGHGVSSSEDGTYNGMWADGVRDGHCFLHTFPCGDTYTGAFRLGYMEGKGLYRNFNGCTYEGDFVHGKQHGEGVLRCVNGVYTGSFVEGKKHGRGKYVFDDKSVYVGEFENGMFHGVGVLTGPSGRAKKSVYNDGLVISTFRDIVDLSSDM
jgi:hypothetical protein